MAVAMTPKDSRNLIMACLFADVLICFKALWDMRERERQINDEIRRNT
jgi:hypothetical protein